MTRDRRTFRLFVSSTFSDLKAERSALQYAVFPRLRSFCLRLGCRFQDVDLRWGISTEAGLDQTTMRVCLREVARCQETTPRPNFVILLGDRYGWCPLPFEIPADEYDAIHGALPAPGIALLTHWYVRDGNAVPPVYWLRPRIRGTPFEDGAVWSEQVEQPLHQMLADCTADWPEETRTRYAASATEQEILAGALRVADAREHVFGFLRTIDGLPDAARDAGFLDPDPALRAKADALHRRLIDQLGPNVERYSARWLDAPPLELPISRCIGAVERAANLLRERAWEREGANDALWRALAAEARAGPTGAGAVGVDASAAEPSPISLDHLPGLCIDVYLRLARVIIAEVLQQEAVHPRAREALAHRLFGEDRARVFAGREAEVNQIASYIREGHPHPLCVIGEPGSGKTALMARVAERMSEWAPDAAGFVRFIGATPESTDGRALLRDLWEGLERSEPPATFPELARELPALLERASAERPRVILLDALDMLSPADRADRLSWLPRTLPGSVRLILSCATGERDAVLARRLPAAPRILLGALTEEEARWLLAEWLTRARRTLDPEQFERVIQGFRRSPLPLYLKLAFEAAAEWHSGFDPPPLGGSAEALIGDLLVRLSAEGQHGPMMVDRCLAYLAAARNGLTEDELLDLLSRDGEVMSSFRLRSPRSPPVTRLPVVVWSRLHYDLHSYLSERSADGTTVFTFYHQQVRRVAADRFLGSAAVTRHRHLARYFQEDARLAVVSGTGAAAFNLRKLSEQAWQETLGESWSSLAATLGNLDWLQAKVESGLGYDASGDFSRAVGALPTRPRSGEDPAEEPRQVLAAFGRAFGQEFHAFLPWPGTAAQQLHNNLIAHAPAPDGPVSPRLQTFAAEPYPRARHWLRRVNAGPSTATPTALMRTIPAHTGAVTALAISPDGAWLASGGADGRVRVWDSHDGSEAASLAASEGSIVGLAWSGEGAARLISGGSDGRLTRWDWEAERADSTATIPGSRPRCLLGLPDGRIVTGGDDFGVRIWSDGEERQLHRHRDRVLCLATDGSGTLVASGSADRTVRIAGLGNGGATAVLRGSEREVRCLTVHPDGAWLASGDETGSIRLWDLRTQTARRAFAAHRHWVTCLALLPARGVLVSGSTDRTIGVWDPDTGLRRAQLRGHRRGVTCMTAAPDQEWFATGGEDGTLCFWRAAELGSRNRSATEEHDAPVTALTRLPSGAGVASASEDCTLRFWSTEGASRTSLHGHIGAVTALATAAGRVISAGADRTIRIWHSDGSGRADILGGASPLQQNLPGHQRTVTCLIPLSGDGELASAGEDGAVWIWDVAGARAVRSMAPVSGSLAALAAGDEWIAAGGTPRELTVWDRDTGTVMRSFTAHEGQVTCLAAVGPEMVASGGLDGGLCLSALRSGQSLRLGSELGRLRAVAWDRDSGAIAAGGDDGTVRLWAAPPETSHRELLGHRSAVRALQFGPGPDGSRLVSASDEGRVSLWRVSDGVLLATLHAGGPVTSLLFLPPDRVWIATANAGVVLYQVITAS